MRFVFPWVFKQPRATAQASPSAYKNRGVHAGRADPETFWGSPMQHCWRTCTPGSIKPHTCPSMLSDMEFLATKPFGAQGRVCQEQLLQQGGTPAPQTDGIAPSQGTLEPNPRRDDVAAAPSGTTAAIAASCYTLRHKDTCRPHRDSTAPCTSLPKPAPRLHSKHMPS